MTYFMNKVSGFKSAILPALDPTNITTTSVDFKYDSSSIPVDFGVSSADNHTFTFEQGSSYLIFASVTMIATGARYNLNIKFGCYDNDTSAFVGKYGQCTAYNSTDDAYNLNPQYSRFASLYLKSSSIPVGGANVSVKFASTLETHDNDAFIPDTGKFRWDLETYDFPNNYLAMGYPTMTIFKTDN